MYKIYNADFELIVEGITGSAAAKEFIKGYSALVNPYGAVYYYVNLDDGELVKVTKKFGEFKYETRKTNG